MTRCDDHPVARREGSPTEARGRQDPSAMSVRYQKGYEGHGGSSGGVHNPPLTQARESQDPSGMSGHSSGYGNAYRGQDGRTGGVYDPPSTQARGSQDPSAMSGHSSGYGIAYKGQGGSTGGVHDPSSTQALSSRQDSNSLSVNSSAYGMPSTIPGPAQGKSDKGNQSHVSSTGHGTADDKFGRYGNGHEGANHDPIQAQGSQSSYKDSHGTGNQPKISSTGYDPVYKPLPTESAGYSTGYDCNNVHDPVQEPPPKEGAAHKPPSKSVPEPTNTARPRDPGNGHDTASGCKDPSTPPAPGAAPPVHLNINLHIGQNPAPSPFWSKQTWRRLCPCCSCCCT